jgi:hypothetical protein
MTIIKTHVEYVMVVLYLLFVLSVEIMALRIRNNKDIKGFQIKIDEQTHSIKISQLADDTTLYFNSKNDISVAMNEIEIFGNFSALMINRNKTEILLYKVLTQIINDSLNPKCLKVVKINVHSSESNAFLSVIS